MIYVGAVEGSSDADIQRYARPSTVLWLQDDVLDLDDAPHREAWYAAAVGPKAKERVRALVEGWGLPFNQWYADNTRETLRDETFPRWREQGALVDRPGLVTSSSRARWALAEAFADLFDPELDGQRLADAIDDWIEAHMSAAGRLKALGVRQMARSTHAVDVTFPTGEQRRLEPGLASHILKGVIEEWAPRRLKSPMVITISEPGDKVFIVDQKVLQAIGVSINVSKLLPDALLADLGSDPVQFWVVEAVASDGPITEDRKAALLSWAASQGIDPAQCRFMTAFASRNASAAKRRLKDLAGGTFAWYLDEPGSELAWNEIPDVRPMAEVVELHSRAPGQ